jgi:hypothetical protein
MPSVVLVAPGSAEMSVQPRVSQEAVKRPSVVAPSVSRARKAKIVAISSSGNTNDTSTLPTSPCSATGIQPSDCVPRRSIPIPKQKKPRGRLLPTGRRTILVTSGWRGPFERAPAFPSDTARARVARRGAR